MEEQTETQELEQKIQSAEVNPGDEIKVISQILKIKPEENLGRVAKNQIEKMKKKYGVESQDFINYKEGIIAETAYDIGKKAITGLDKEIIKYEKEARGLHESMSIMQDNYLDILKEEQNVNSMTYPLNESIDILESQIEKINETKEIVMQSQKKGYFVQQVLNTIAAREQDLNAKRQGYMIEKQNNGNNNSDYADKTNKIKKDLNQAQAQYSNSLANQMTAIMKKQKLKSAVNILEYRLGKK